MIFHIAHHSYNKFLYFIIIGFIILALITSHTNHLSYNQALQVAREANKKRWSVVLIM